MKVLRLKSVLALPLIMLSIAPARAACLGYGQTVQLEGTLSFREYPGPPNYDDKSPPMTVWFIAPTQPICVDADPDPAAQPANVAAKDLREIEVVAAFPPGAGVFRNLRGKQVHLSGALHGRTGSEQKTPVILGEARVDQPQKPGS